MDIYTVCKHLPRQLSKKSICAFTYCYMLHTCSVWSTFSLTLQPNPSQTSPQPSPGAPGRLTPVGCSPGSEPLGERWCWWWRWCEHGCGCRASWGCCQWSGLAADRGCRYPGPTGGGTPACAGGPAEARAETGAAVALSSRGGSSSLKRQKENEIKWTQNKLTEVKVEQRRDRQLFKLKW